MRQLYKKYLVYPNIFRSTLFFKTILNGINYQQFTVNKFGFLLIFCQSREKEAVLKVVILIPIVIGRKICKLLSY